MLIVGNSYIPEYTELKQAVHSSATETNSWIAEKYNKEGQYST
jgi:hypothetical protein